MEKIIFYQEKMNRNFFKILILFLLLKIIERRMSSKYIAKSVTDNREHYRRFVRALRVGISSIYYRDNENVKEILKIYDQYIFIYVHSIHYFIMKELEKYVEITSGTMYQNHLVLIILFFLIDFERGMKRMGLTDSIEYPNEMVANFVKLLFEEGFKGDMNGLKEFDCNILQMIHILGVDRMDLFDRLRLLKIPRISILYQKFPQNIPSPVQELTPIPTDNEILRAENQELKRVLQLALQDINIIQTQKLEILRDRETFRSTIVQMHTENESLKAKIAKLEQERILHTLTSPRALERFDLSLLF